MNLYQHFQRQIQLDLLLVFVVGCRLSFVVHIVIIIDRMNVKYLHHLRCRSQRWAREVNCFHFITLPICSSSRWFGMCRAFKWGIAIQLWMNWSHATKCLILFTSSNYCITFKYMRTLSSLFDIVMRKICFYSIHLPITSNVQQYFQHTMQFISIFQLILITIMIIIKYYIKFQMRFAWEYLLPSKLNWHRFSWKNNTEAVWKRTCALTQSRLRERKSFYFLL